MLRRRLKKFSSNISKTMKNFGFIINMLRKTAPWSCVAIMIIDTLISFIPLAFVYVNKKMDRIEKYFGEDFDVSITFRAERNEQIAEMTVKSVTGTFRAVTAHNDLYASIDKDLDIIEGQVRKMKTKKDKANKEDSIKNLPVDLPEREIEGEIIKTIYYDLKPMTPEDAILKLQEKPTDRFVTFINSETNKVNVLFKLKDNKNFGLCEPDV